MKNSGPWIALVLFLGLAAYIRFFESRRPVKTAAADTSFLAVEPTRVVAITAAWLDTTRLEKRSGAWFIVSPTWFPADPFAVEALLSRCRNLPLRRQFPIEPGEESRYGLERPRASIRLDLDDSTSVTLRIGAPAPASPAFFVQVAGRHDVGVMADTEVDNYFRKELNGWRRRNLFALSAGDIQSIELATSGRATVRLARGGAPLSWRLEKPFPGPAEARAVDEFVKGLLAMKARSYPEDHPQGLSRYGLDRPAAMMAVHLKGGRSDSLLIGAVFDQPTGPERYARTNEFATIFGVPPGYVGVAGRSDLSFRQRRPFQTVFRAARSLVLKRGETSLTLRPDSTGAWRAPGEAPSGGVVPPDRGDLVQGWVEIRADSITAEAPGRFPGGSRPLEVRLLGADREESLVVGSPVTIPGRGEIWPARLILSDPPRPGEVFLLAPGLIRQTLALLGADPGEIGSRP
jgi:hypothetical protein